jgi:16S rRNA G966 N2-methylase RsmD
MSISYFKKIFGNNIKMYNLKKIKMDDVAKYSVTHYEHSLKIVDIILNELQKDIVITDVCACVGADTITFGKYCKQVNAIELNNTRYEYLKHNLLVANVKNVITYNNDCLDIISTLKQDVIYIDAPWGGPDYKYKRNINLYLSNKSLTSLIPFFLRFCKLLVIKVPFNFVFNELNQYNYKSYDLQKFFIITIK